MLLYSFPGSQSEEILDNRMKDYKQWICKALYYSIKSTKENFHLDLLHCLTPNNLIENMVWKSLQSTFDIISEHRIQEHNMFNDKYYWTPKWYFSSLIPVHISAWNGLFLFPSKVLL